MDLKACEVCGSAAEQEILSGHSTSLGRVIYVRCGCGGMGVQLITYDAAAAIVELAGPAGQG
ncbi:hypothetical protein GCM10010149_32190 [Nonomuraea roseoviolacea subsp. roseoviolacea]|uniref:Uncharacterized protein n=1 Tax=Nonomuraea roseoviolacea subsp. carminata TaxID=160689 RepID=A0ABT1K3L0_9ACTN|nr:hypothetical protein [Nonomuraea roseoviolacea]MCP2348252.1 hypothetical protein [Nonomuraea roseoviolacea subsp. carminata]